MHTACMAGLQGDTAASGQTCYEEGGSIHKKHRYDDDTQRKIDHRREVLHPPLPGKLHPIDAVRVLI
jgi:hypothetical protein